MTTVTVLIPTIPPRAVMLARALASVKAQTRQPDAIVAWLDHEGLGAAGARNAALEGISTDFVALLDDDDEFLPHHIHDLMETQAATGADMVYPEYKDGIPGLFAGLLDRPFTDETPAALRRGNFIPITCLVRTAALKAVGGFVGVPGRATAEDDWGTWLRLLDGGYTFAHHPGITWQWNTHYRHTSGHPWTETAAAHA